ncbi:MAG: inositol-3-phosphate synthase [Planctomycetota bacterium]|nr:inositol-3-phosphate synthase [Planctomycetota bacterium]
MSRTGVWLVGARGGVSTTVIAGLAAIQQGRKDRVGLLTETSLFENCDLPPLDDLIIGGHEVREGSLLDSARAICADSGSLGHELIAEIATTLEQVDSRIRPGILFNAGKAILSLEGIRSDCVEQDPAQAVARIEQDLREFRTENDLSGVVVVNLSSTEAALPPHPSHGCAEELLQQLAQGTTEPFRSSTLYAIAAAQVGASFVNFTPSPAALLPATCQLLEEQGCPFAGSDGKTGETLVKSALAPMFFQRALKVLSWQGYNMLGDRDGEILSCSENRQTKIESKGELIKKILGEDVHSQVSIDYVPSLGDNKTAWDLIHFEGFLGHRMTMQFTWQGCDAVLAAPLVLDLCRLMEWARQRGDAGLQQHCGLFFKSPHQSEIYDLSSQFQALTDYLQSCRQQADPSGSP